MHKLFWNYIGFGIAFLSQLTIAAIILWRGVARRWPAVLVYCATSLITSAIMLPLPRSSSTYQFLYWAWIFVSPFLRLFILGDVIRSIPANGIVSQNVRIGIAGAASVLALFAAAAAMSDHSVWLGATKGIAQVDRSVSIGWGAFLVVVLLAIKALRLGWSSSGARMVIGLTTYVVGAMVSSFITSTHPDRPHLSIALRSTFAVAAFGIWIAALTSADLDSEVYPTVDSLIERSPA